MILCAHGDGPFPWCGLAPVRPVRSLVSDGTPEAWRPEQQEHALPLSTATWISVDVETSGPTPGTGCLLSIGACLVDRPEEGIELRLKPDPALPWSEAAAAVHGLDQDDLLRTGLEPSAALEMLEAWIAQVVPPGAHPVFVALNAPFDWMFVADAAWRHLGRNPFGHSALDIKALFLGRHLAELESWSATARVRMLERYPVQLPHTHHALDDAREQAAICRRILEGVQRDEPELTAAGASLAAEARATAAEASEARLRQALDTVLDLYAIYRPIISADGRYVDATISYVNKAWQRFFLGRLDPSVLGRSVYEVLPSLRDRLELHARVFLHDEAYRGSFEVDTPRGRRFVDLNMTRSADEIIAFTRDLTEQRRTEAALIESREMLRMSMDAVIEGYGIYRGILDERGRYTDGVVVYANEVWKRQYSPNDPNVEGRSLYSFTGARLRFHVHAHVFETGEPFRDVVDVQTPDGPRNLDLQMVKFGDYFVGSSRDITEQRRAEAALKESERRYREMVEGIDAIVWNEDVRAGRLYTSAQSERMTGYPSDAWQDPEFWASTLVPEDRERVIAALTGPDDVDIEFRMTRADGQVRWFRDRMRVVNDDNGQPIHRLGVTIDVTDRKELEDRLRRSERFSSVGQLAANVAHDFDNTLYGITLMAEHILAGHLDPADPEHEDADAILRAVHGAKELTGSLKSFAREQPALRGRVMVDETIGRMEPMLGMVVGSPVRLVLRLHAGPVAAVGDTSAFEQILLNLALNARDAMPRGGTLAIETRVADLDPEDAEDLDVEPQRGIVVAVRDTGVGMDAETRSRAFEPYFTTKEVGQGTGLGLATVYGTVKAANGGISISSSPDKGTEFRIFLPAAPTVIAKR